MKAKKRYRVPEKPVAVVATKAQRNAAGQFLKGSAGSPGRPPLGNTSLDKLLQAITRVETEKGRKLVDHYVARAYKSDAVLVSVMKKCYPDLMAVASLNFDQQMSDATAASIREKLEQRF